MCHIIKFLKISAKIEKKAPPQEFCFLIQNRKMTVLSLINVVFIGNSLIFCYLHGELIYLTIITR
jgi:hypothetical protein